MAEDPAGLVADVRRALAAGAPPERLPELVASAAAARGAYLGVDDLRTTAARVRSELWGAGVLQDLLEDPRVTDVLVNAPDEVWVDRGEGLVPAAVSFAGEGAVRALAVRLAAAAGRRLDEAMPWVDARLPDGVRLHAVLPPVAPSGTLLSLRVLRSVAPDLAVLAVDGSVPPGWARVLEALVRRRAAFLVSGGTGAGKTTLLAALLSRAAPAERLVLVEDVGELRPRHPHVVRLEARHANVEGRGEVTLADLVRQALRMRPDRLVVGECRGAEVRDLLAALNTGHAGGAGTLHANRAADVPARLEALASMAGMSGPAIRTQAAAALDAVVHVERVSGRRRVTALASVVPAADGGLTLADALVADPADPWSDGHRGPGWPHLAARLGLEA